LHEFNLLLISSEYHSDLLVLSPNIWKLQHFQTIH